MGACQTVLSLRHMLLGLKHCQQVSRHASAYAGASESSLLACSHIAHPRCGCILPAEHPGLDSGKRQAIIKRTGGRRRVRCRRRLHRKVKRLALRMWRHGHATNGSLTCCICTSSSGAQIDRALLQDHCHLLRREGQVRDHCACAGRPEPAGGCSRKQRRLGRRATPCDVSILLRKPEF